MNGLKRNNKRLFTKPTVKHKHPKTLKTMDHKSLRRLALAFAIVLAAGIVYIHFLMPHTLEAKQRVQLESTQSQLIQTKHKLQQEQSQSIQDDESKAKQIEDLNKQIQEKDQQLQAKAASKTAYAATIDAPAKTYPVPEDTAKAYIYSHESGNSPSAKNSIGCYGIGQACDKGALERACGADYACQDTYFTNYMLNRYGSWNNAKAFWIANQWW